MSNRAMALATIDEFLESHDIDFEKSSETAYLLTLPGEKKLQTQDRLLPRHDASSWSGPVWHSGGCMRQRLL